MCYLVKYRETCRIGGTNWKIHAATFLSKSGYGWKGWKRTGGIGF